jgi:hypothetical protein
MNTFLTWLVSAVLAMVFLYGSAIISQTKVTNGEALIILALCLLPFVQWIAVLGGMILFLIGAISRIVDGDKLARWFREPFI